MARPPSPKHSQQPLRVLRGLTKATLAEFSQMTGIPVNTLRGIENGQRKLNDSMLKSIRDRLFAAWNEKHQEWVWVYSNPPQAYTYGLFDQYRTFITQLAPMPDDPDRIKLRVDALFKHVPTDQWMRLFWNLQGCLEDCRDDVGLAKDKRVAKAFNETEGAVHFSGMPGRNLFLGRIGGKPMEVQGSADLTVKPQVF